ncbi:hypothetical protein BJ742DRAFT_834180 [Cladochytrium replicatum]|nr:hypothetical protein BJ742DRAFT_834180 [Cladochytrium replicatum]
MCTSTAVDSICWIDFPTMLLHASSTKAPTKPSSLTGDVVARFRQFGRLPRESATNRKRPGRCKMALGVIAIVDSTTSHGFPPALRPRWLSEVQRYHRRSITLVSQSLQGASSICTRPSVLHHPVFFGQRRRAPHSTSILSLKTNPSAKMFPYFLTAAMRRILFPSKDDCLLESALQQKKSHSLIGLVELPLSPSGIVRLKTLRRGQSLYRAELALNLKAHQRTHNERSTLCHQYAKYTDHESPVNGLRPPISIDRGVRRFPSSAAHDW